MHAMKIRRPLRMLAVTLISILCISPALADARVAQINNSDARIYARSGAYGTLPKGTSVAVTEVKDGWAKIKYKKITGYVKTKYLSADKGVTGYVKSDATLYKSASGDKAGTLKAGEKVEVWGVSGEYYQVSCGKLRGYVKKGNISRDKPAPDAESWAAKVQLAQWYDGGSTILARGSYGYIYDIKTGVTLRIKRMGGSNHADVEPATKADTLKLKKIGGGSFSWDSHAVILRAGDKYVAAAINTMPHGDQTITNNGYDGQFCLHMLGSKTHGSGVENENHQKAIRAAYKWAQSR